MFNYIMLKNYKSLIDFKANFVGKRGMPKKLILIYGENGVGKSNLASAFYTLSETLRTKSVKEMWDIIREKSDIKQNNKSFEEFLKHRFRDLESIINNCKTVQSEENMILEFGFKLKGKNGVYRIETNNSTLVSEQLEFVWNKNKTTFFDIKENSIKINKNIFKRLEYEKEIKELINKYWGKHTLLSLIVYEIEDKKDNYVKSRISKELFDVISFFRTFSIRVKDGNRVEKGTIGLKHRTLSNLQTGTIPQSQSKDLDKAEELLNLFFTHLYSDIKQVYYKRELLESGINYRLIVKKYMFDKLLDIDFAKESTGTQYLLELIPFLISSIEGNTVILDEMDTGIHDLLIYSILENLNEYIKGQIIITTHNTMLLEAEFAKDSVYIFNVSSNANKELIPLAEFEDRIHPNLNIRKRYLKGLYGGIPVTVDIDYDELAKIME